MLKVLKSNLGYKLISVAAAVLLWAYAQSQQNPLEVKRFEVGIKLINQANQLFLVSAPEKTHVTVTGLRREIEKLSSDTIAATVDLRNAKEGKNVLPVQVRMSEEVVVRQIHSDPTDAEVMMDIVVSHSMKVEENMMGTPPPGYEIGEPTLEPLEANVSGPRHRVSKIKRLVVNLDVSNPNLASSFSSPVIAVDANGQEITDLKMEPSQVNITLPLRTKLATKTCPVKLVVFGYPASPMRLHEITPEPSVVTVKGSVQKLSQLEYIETEKFLLTGMTQSAYRTVALRPPAGVTILGMKTVHANIKLVKKQSPYVRSENRKAEE